MFQKLKIVSAKKTIEKNIQNHAPASVKTIRKIGIIIDENLVAPQLAEKLQKKAQELSNHVECIGFSNKKNNQWKLPVFSENDLGWKGKFKPQSKAFLFRKNHYDVLINYFEETTCQELFILAAMTKARLKVGFPMKNNRLNDLEIKVIPEKTNEFINELKKYTAIINEYHEKI